MSVSYQSMQSNLASWVSLKKSADEVSSRPPVSGEEKKAMATTLGLPWPEPRVKPCKGRPTTLSQWQKRIYLLLRMGRLDQVKDLDAHKVPPHWEPGMEVDAQPVVAVTSALALADPAPSTAEPPQAAPEEEVDDVGEAEAKEEPEQKKRKRASPCPRSYQLWFLAWAEFMHKNHGWSWQRSWAQAKEWLPEIYGVYDKQGWRNWEKVGVQPKGLGRPLGSGDKKRHKIDDAELQACSTICLSLVEKGAPMSRHLMQEIINQRILPKTVSIHWVGDFLKGLGLSWQLTKRGDSAKFTPEEAAAFRCRLKLKLHFLMEMPQRVDIAHVWNLDETFMKLLPMPRRAWLSKEKPKKPEQFVPDDKAGFTVTLVTPALWGGPAWVQLCVKGKTERVLPSLDGCGPRVSVTKSESGWATTETILELVRIIESSMEPETPWILVWDVAPTHISENTRLTLRAEHPFLTLCYVEARTTAICQPLDIAYMASYKASVRRQWCRVVARRVLETHSAVGTMVRQLDLKTQLPVYLDVALQETHTEARVETAWKHLLGNHEELYEEAQALDEQGLLFNPEPEAPEEEMCEPEGELSILDEGEDDGLVAAPEEEMCEPAWSEPLDLSAGVAEGMASSSSSAAPSAIDPATVVPPTRVGQISRFLALRLIYGTPSQKDLAEALRQA